MFIHKVISFRGAWADLTQNHADELSDIRAAIASLNVQQFIERRKSNKYNVNAMGIEIDSYNEFINSLEHKGWVMFTDIADITNYSNVRLGVVKNDVSVLFAAGYINTEEWIYVDSAIIFQKGLIKVPILVMFTENALYASVDRSEISVTGSRFEWVYDKLSDLSPLAHNSPFLIFGLESKEREFSVIEIPLKNVGDFDHHAVTIRSIEFPPEYHQAGIGILSYFGTVLREKHPENKAKVKIEQEGFTVRLIVESENGEKEVIEKLLHKYELVVRGEAPPESLLESRAQIIELKNELRIAYMRIESKQDLIEYQREENMTLRQLFGHHLSRPTALPQPITIINSTSSTSDATSTATATAELHQHLTEAHQHVQKLAAVAEDNPTMQARLQELEQAVKSAAENPEAAKESGVMKKVREFLDEASQTGSAVNKFIEQTGKGVKLAQKLGRKYNEFAPYFGLLSVPPFLLGKEEK